MAILISNLGNSDFQPYGIRQSEDERIDNQIIYQEMKRGYDWGKLNFPILKSVEQLLKSRNETLNALVLFYTKQKDEHFSKSDTYIIFKIIQLYNERNQLFDSYKPIVIGMQICDLPHSYDSMYTYYQKVIKGLPGQLAQHGLVSDEPVYVSLAGGTPACNVGLLHAMHQSTDFRSTKTFIYSPRPAKGELQPPAVPVRIDTYLTANELVKNLDELLTGYHYGQVKDLISKLNLPIHEFLKDILTFLDVLLLRRNTRYAEALTKLKTIGHSELKNTAFFQECLGQINKLDKGIQAHDDRQFGWTSCSEFRQVLHEHYWKLVTLYQLEEYNEWAIGMMTFYENLLRIKATHLLGFDRKQPSLTPEEEKVQFHKKLCDLNNRSFNGKREYPIKRGEYQRIISDSAPKSMLCKRHSWVRKLEKIYKQRNNVVHQFGGLTKSDIENVFGESDNWKKLLRQALNREFQIQINENPLDLIHKQLLEWIHKRLVA